MSFEIPSQMGLVDRIKFLQGYAELVGVFGAETVDNLLMLMPLNKLLGIRHEDASRRNPPRPIGNELYLGVEPNYVNETIVVGGKEYSRTERVNCHHYLTSANIQHLATTDYIIKPAVQRMWPWLQGFKLAIYSKLDEIYVALGGTDSLYVPYKALMLGDFHLVQTLMDEYFRWYTKGEKTWDYFKDLPETIRFKEAFDANLTNKT